MLGEYIYRDAHCFRCQICGWPIYVLLFLVSVLQSEVSLLQGSCLLFDVSEFARWCDV